MWTRCRYQMFLSAPPPCPIDHSNLLYSSAAPPSFLTPGVGEVPEPQRGAAMFRVQIVRLAISGGQPPLPLLSSGFSL